MADPIMSGGVFNSFPATYNVIPASGTTTIASNIAYVVPAGCNIAFYNLTISGTVIVAGNLIVNNTFSLSNYIVFQGGTLLVGF